MGVTISNLTRQPKLYILHAPGEMGELLPKSVQSVVTERYDAKTGARSTSTTKRPFPGSISLQPKGFEGDTLTDLPIGVAYADEVARDARAGLLKVEIAPDAALRAPDEPPHESDLSTPEEA